VFGFAGAFGVEPVGSILSHIPVLQGLKNDRLILLSDFGLAALAGIGVTHLEKLGQGYELLRQRLVRIGIVLATSSIVLSIVVYKLYAATIHRAGYFERPSFTRAMLIAGIALLAWKMVRGSSFRTFGLAACALVAFDLLTFGFGYTGFARRDQIFPKPEVFDFIQKQGSLRSFRIAPGAVCVYASNSPMAFGLESVTGYEVTVPPRLRRMTADITEDLQPYVGLISEKVLAIEDRRLDLLNLKYLIVPTDRPEYAKYRARPERFREVYTRQNMAVFENPHVLPRAFLVGAQDVRVLPDPAAQVEKLKDPAFDPLQNVILERHPEEFQALELSGTAEAPFTGSVNMIDSDPDGYRFRVQATTPAVLVVSQNYFPGWRANVDGRPLSVFPAYHALMGIAVPPGDYVLDVVYEPRSFKWGALLSLAAAGALAGLTLFRVRTVRE
jgi:hypothetical protein